MKSKLIVLNLSVLFITILVTLTEASLDKPQLWRGKDVRDMTDADFEKLLEEWQKDDDPLEPDELPEYSRPSPNIDISKLDSSDPDNVLKMTKKGKTLMMFVDIIEDFPEHKIEGLLTIWQTSLQNNHINAERYPIDTRRFIFMFREGSQAIDAKNYLLQQPELSHVTIEGQVFYRDPEQQAIHNAQMGPRSEL